MLLPSISLGPVLQQVLQVIAHLPNHAQTHSGRLIENPSVGSGEHNCHAGTKNLLLVRRQSNCPVESWDAWADQPLLLLLPHALGAALLPISGCKV
jgi:hypothetical protein